MPPLRFALMLLYVIAGAGLTIGLARFAGLPMAALGLVALVLALLLRGRK